MTWPGGRLGKENRFDPYWAGLRTKHHKPFSLPSPPYSTFLLGPWVNGIEGPPEAGVEGPGHHAMAHFSTWVEAPITARDRGLEIGSRKFGSLVDLELFFIVFRESQVVFSLEALSVFICVPLKLSLFSFPPPRECKGRRGS